MESNNEVGEIKNILDNVVEAKSKCGEIFITKAGHISCYCLMCERDFENFLAFSNHVLKDHLKLDYLNDDGDFCKKSNVRSVSANKDFTNFIHKNLNKIKTESSFVFSKSQLKAKKINYNIKLLNNFDCSHQEIEQEYVTSSENPLKAQTGNTEFNIPIQRKNAKQYTCKLCEQHLTKTEISQNKKLGCSLDITDLLYCEKCVQELPISKNKIKHDAGSQVQQPRETIHLIENFEIYREISKTKGNSKENEVVLKKINQDFKFYSLIKDKNRTVKGINYCELCSKNFISQKEYDEHMSNFHEKYIPEKVLTIIPKKYMNCPRNFEKINFKKPEESYKKVEVCDYCGKLFANKNSKYQQHLRCHTGEKPFVCSICLNAFVSRGNLNHHISTAHSEQRPYICTWQNCGKGFKIERQRLLHERIHTGEKPYQCEQCGEHFAFHHKLNLHKKRKHLDKKDRPHKCDLCEKAFVLRRQLREHKYTHTGEKPNQCDICPARFAKRGVLIEHKKLHTGEKKHVCEICGRAFAQRAGYSSHIKSHT